MRRLRPGLIGSAAVVVTVLLLYGRFVADPAQYFIGDLVSFYQPARHVQAQCLAGGELPLWSPSIFAGVPLFADPQTASFYPPTLIHLAVGFPLAELLAFLLHVIAAGLGMLWLGRVLRLGWAPAMLGALSYCLGGFFIVHLVHPNFVHSAAWVPLGAVALRRLLETGNPRWAAATALATGLLILAGGGQIAFYGLGLLGVLGVVWSLDPALGLPRRLRLKRGGAAVGALVLGGFVAACQLLPTLEFVSHSIRADGVSLELARSYRLSARGVLHLIVPHAFGVQGATAHVGGFDQWEAFAYGGAAILPLAVVALVGRPRRVRWALGAVVAVAALGALGPDAVVDVHAFLYRFVPGFGSFRAPGRLLFVVAFLLALLAAYGLHDLLHGAALARRRARRAFAGAGLLALGVAGALYVLASGVKPLYAPPAAALAQASAIGVGAALLGIGAFVLLGPRFELAGKWIAVGVILVHAVDLLASGRAMVGARQPPPGVDLRRTAHRLPTRVRARSGSGPRVLYTPRSYFMLQNLGQLHGYDNVRAYHPLMLRRTYDLLHLAQSGRFAPWTRLPVDHNLIRPRHYRAPVMRLLGVRYLLTLNRPAAPMTVREVPGGLPRAFVVYRTALVPRRAEREALLRRFDPGRVVAVETPAAALSPATGAPTSATPARIVRRSRCGGGVTIAARAHAPGMLVFTESWYPGWRAYVAGRERRLFRVDHALMGIKLARGEHRIELRLEPGSLALGIRLTLAALLGLLGLVLWPWVWPWARRRLGRAPTTSARSPAAPPAAARTGDGRSGPAA